MAPTHVIRIPRTDSSESDTFVLGEVSPSGSKPLNLKFVATEGEEPYVVKLRQDRIGGLRVGTSPCSPDEWEKILKAVLLGHEPVEGIEAGAEAQVGKAITVTIRRRVAGISQRLGAIKLDYKPDEGIQLFDWCGAAILEREKLRAAVLTEAARVQDLESRLKKMKDQLDELTQAKKAGEVEMLEKFCLLLNEKKVKIREQQRLLATARVDPAKLAVLPAAVPASPKRVPKASRASKRKAPVQEASDESDDGFERMDVDRTNDAREPSPLAGKEDESELEEGRQTPDEDETETGSEPKEEEEEQPLPSASSYQRKKPGADKGKGKGRDTTSPPSKPASKGGETLTMHPKPTAASPSPAKAAVARHRPAPAPAPDPADDSETESDDEL